MGGGGEGVRTKSQVSPDGARREAALLEPDIEGHVMPGEDGRSLGCPLLVPVPNGQCQAPCQLFYQERVHAPSQLGMAARPAPPHSATHLPFYLSPSRLQNSRAHPSWGPGVCALQRDWVGVLGPGLEAGCRRLGGKMSGWAGGLPRSASHLGPCLLPSGVQDPWLPSSLLASLLLGLCLGHTFKPGLPSKGQGTLSGPG